MTGTTSDAAAIAFVPSELTKCVSAAPNRVKHHPGTVGRASRKQRQQRVIKQGGLWKINWT